MDEEQATASRINMECKTVSSHMNMTNANAVMYAVISQSQTEMPFSSHKILPPSNFNHGN